MLALRNSLAITLAALLVAACSTEESVQVGGADSLLIGYWDLPLAEQGDTPEGWSVLEQSLAPEDCGQCHPDQYRDWSTTLHSRAFSPGLVGQLVNYGFDDAASCMECHAPLVEQRVAFEMARVAGSAHMTRAQGIAATGNGCAGCHVRQHRRFGPPRREKAAEIVSDPPHGGVHRTPYFESSGFCKVCHQFPQEMAINGKPLENTYVEWKASPQAAEGMSCQSCHMPDRRHLWRGIHDRDMTAGGLTPRFHTDGDRARFELTSSGVAHAFPTYATPKVMMRGVALDDDGEPRPDTEVSFVIQRKIESIDGEWVEHFDTRLMPGETATLEIKWQGSDRARMWLEVHPDDFYDHDVYDVLLETLPALSPAAALIADADRQAVANRYRLFETVLERPE